MAVTISLYNHTASKFADGSFAVGDTYTINLYTALTFDATNTTLASVVGTQVSTAFGYTQDAKNLASVAVNIVTTNDANFDAADVQWTASGGAIAAAKALIYNNTDANDPPVAYIDLDGSQSAGDGTTFNIVWSASGIVTFTVT
jgi:hypothetical protein